MKTADLTKGVEDFLHNSITKVFLVAFGAENRKWQNSNRADLLFPLLAVLTLALKSYRCSGRIFVQSDQVKIN